MYGSACQITNLEPDQEPVVSGTRVPVGYRIRGETAGVTGYESGLEIRAGAIRLRWRHCSRQLTHLFELLAGCNLLSEQGCLDSVE